MSRMKRQFVADVKALKASAMKRKNAFEDKQRWMANNIQDIVNVLADVMTVAESTQRMVTRFIRKVKIQWGTEAFTSEKKFFEVTSTGTQIKKTKNAFSKLDKALLTGIKKETLITMAQVLYNLGYKDYS